MPWLTCTTGSPTLSSDRSLISALTSLTGSCLRRRAPRRGANSSVSVTNSMRRVVFARQTKPCGQRRRRRSRSFSSPDSNSASERHAGRLDAGCRAAARAGSRAGPRSRRPSARGAACRDVVAAAGARVRCAPRSTLRSGSGRAQCIGVRVARRAAPSSRMARAAAKKLLGLEEQQLRRQQRPLRVVLQEAVAFAGVGPEALQRGVDLAVQRPASPPRRGSRRRSRSRRRTAAGSTRCRRWRCRRRCPCRCARLGRVALDALAPARAEARRAPPRPSGTRGRAAGALRAPGTGCAGCRDRRCGSNRSRRRTGRRGRAPREPIGNRSIRPPRTAYSPGDTTWLTWL